MWSDMVNVERSGTGLPNEAENALSHPFEIIEPAAWKAPVVFNSPHSGSCYPPDFLRSSRLDLATLQKSEDSFVDEFIVGLAQRGFGVMRAHFPRSYIDVNREPYELDPRMYSSRLPSYANTRSMRVAGGLGTIPRVVGDAQEIYRERISAEDALRRIEALYKPYHRELRRLISRAHRQFGAVILVDCHSMPSAGASHEDTRRADIVIGDRYGASCAPVITATIEATLVRLGYSVSRNKPYAGGFITEHYGHPADGFHSIQIEINRSVYLNESTRARLPRFEQVTADFAVLAEALGDIGREQLWPVRTAAE
jgi:N-formylglutamate amidohydrolase